MERKNKDWDNLTKAQRDSVPQLLSKLISYEKSWQDFKDKLERVVTRQIKKITITPLQGSVYESNSIEDIIDFVKGYSEPLRKYEMQLIYNNGDSFKQELDDKQSVLDLLDKLRPDS